MNRKIALFFILSCGFFFAGTAKAICPLCVVAVGGGLGLSRWLGVDDLVSSLWIGALLVAVSIWTINWLKKKNKIFPYYIPAVFFAYYGLTFAPMHYAGMLWRPLNSFLGIDKIILGAAAGTLIFILAVWTHNFLKKKNGDKSYFPYQKVVLPFGAVMIASLILFFIIR